MAWRSSFYAFRTIRSIKDLAVPQMGPWHTGTKWQSMETTYWFQMYEVSKAPSNQIFVWHRMQPVLTRWSVKRPQHFVAPAAAAWICSCCPPKLSKWKIDDNHRLSVPTQMFSHLFARIILDVDYGPLFELKPPCWNAICNENGIFLFFNRVLDVLDLLGGHLVSWCELFMFQFLNVFLGFEVGRSFFGSFHLSTCKLCRVHTLVQFAASLLEEK